MQDKITIADAPDCLNTNDKAMWVLGYQAALAARSTCLHQIQEPAPAQAAPAVAEKPDEAQIKALMRKHRIWIEHSTLFEDDEPPRELRAVQAEQHQFESFVRELIALAATPAADAPVGPDDAEIIAALEAAGVAFLKFFGGRDGKTLVHTTSGYQKASSLIAGCRALLAAAAGLPAQAVPLKLIEAINTACGGNEWQGDALATDLLQPACRAIASLAPQAQADARDAKRYRWCREQAEFYPMVLDGTGLLCADLAEAESGIDAAIAAQAAQGGE